MKLLTNAVISLIDETRKVIFHKTKKVKIKITNIFSFKGSFFIRQRTKIQGLGRSLVIRPCRRLIQAIPPRSHMLTTNLNRMCTYTVVIVATISVGRAQHTSITIVSHQSRSAIRGVETMWNRISFYASLRSIVRITAYIYNIIQELKKGKLPELYVKVGLFYARDATVADGGKKKIHIEYKLSHQREKNKKVQNTI